MKFRERLLPVLLDYLIIVAAITAADSPYATARGWVVGGIVALALLRGRKP